MFISRTNYDAQLAEYAYCTIPVKAVNSSRKVGVFPKWTLLHLCITKIVLTINYIAASTSNKDRLPSSFQKASIDLVQEKAKWCISKEHFSRGTDN